MKTVPFLWVVETMGQKREGMQRDEFVRQATSILEDIQSKLFANALAFRDQYTREIESLDELYEFFTSKNSSKPEIHGGFALAHWDRDPQWEEKLKQDLKVTIRCIPEEAGESGVCIFSGKPSPGRVVLAKSY